MEIKNFIKIYKLNYKWIILSSILSTIIFIIFYLILPQQYFAEGTLYVYPVEKSKQNTEVSNELNYARNLIALSNSPEFKSQLKDLNISSYTYSPLIGIVGNFRLKEISPNILFLSVKGSSEAEVMTNYQLYYKSLKDFSENLKRGNSSFELDRLEERPIVNKGINNLIQFIILGFLSGTFVSSIYFYHKRK